MDRDLPRLVDMTTFVLCVTVTVVPLLAMAVMGVFLTFLGTFIAQL